MAWRQVVEADLSSALSGAEVEAYRSNADLENDPVEKQIASVVAYVRGCIKSGGHATLSDDESYLPESLIGPAMDYLRYRILTRMNVGVNESRAKLYDDARELFEAVSQGEFIPESDGVEDDSADKALSPAAAPGSQPPLLD